ncbi:rho family-interacting cell polarization regulator 1 isoform X2 [Melanerpes formicivorus]|uniref:rho family-interacting cell polarization regulator 1 isoform X2 n=1 Tax=Melanerpes formicivorus TaxID=211600 RepID=UPI00358FC68D
MNGKPRGRPCRSPSTMSLSVRPQRRALVPRISRSQSFAGVNCAPERPLRNLSPFTPTVSRKAGSRVSRMFSMSHKSPPPKVPQPNRLDEVYEALKKGLTAYLEVHQLELEKLSTQIRESKRNSRLGFLYDLDKQVKAIERFLRRLEFHASKIDELYEAYCIQRRLRDGAHNMVRAYSSGSPGSREARDSLAEASRGYKEYTENMCVLESELESQLGEFHVRMKGLAGFARLCAGDQYEIFMKYGRQRWKLRGRIEVNSKQVWDSEEMVFLPLVTEFLSIKVTELKSLANHVVVGNVSCETKDLFAALPQVVAVDINDLGTLKLSLEVTWNPFDKDDQPSAASSVNKACTVSKRFSTYNQSPPDTPSLREQAFYSPGRASAKHGWSLVDICRETLLEKLSQSCSCGDVSSAELGRWPRQGRNMLRRQEELENGTAWSISSESSDDSSSPQLSGSARHATHRPLVQPELQASAPAIDISFCQQPEEPGPAASAAPQPGCQPQELDPLRKEAVANGHVPYCRTLSHISEASVDATTEAKAAEGPWEVAPSPEDTGVCEQDTDTLPGASVAAPAAGQDRGAEAKPRAAAAWAVEEAEVAEPAQSQALAQGGCGTAVPTVLARAPTEERPILALPLPASVPEVPREKVVDSGLEEAISLLGSALDDYRGQFPELQPLERELKHLEEMLLHKQGIFLSRASSISLTVEHALESFSFLNTSDMEDSEGSEEEPLQDDRKAGRPRRSSRAPSAGEAGAEDAGMGSGSEASTDPMSTGNEFLDKALVLHLNSCNRLLLKLGTFGPLRCQEMYALDRLLREAQVLEVVCQLLAEHAGTASSAADVVQFSTRKEGVLSLWDRCVEVPNIYTCPVERFLQVLSAQYTAPISERHPGLADAVCVKLVEDILNRRLPRRPGSAQGEQVTIFQYWSHFESLGALVLDTYMMELAEEALLAQNLNSDEQDVVLRALKRVPEGRLKREALKALSLLLVEGNSKVVSAVSGQLRSLADSPRFRQRALVCYLEQLEDEEVQTRVAGCVALGCLKAKESIEQLVYLCQTDKEPVREAAKQSLMLCGEDGRSAHRRLEETLDSLPRIFAPASMASTAF